MADWNSLPSAADRFKLSNKISSGVWGTLYEADDSKSGKKVAIKVTNLSEERQEEFKNEYAAYKGLEHNENIPSLVGFFKKQARGDAQQAWTVTEFCNGGTVGDYVRSVQKQNKRLPEEHIAYILREITKGIVHLHEGNVIHRNVRADNVLLSLDGRMKLSNLSLSAKVSDQESKLEMCIGSPSWLAPEVATCEFKKHDGYDVRADVWALGVTAIELGDGKPPLIDVTPARAIFQITKNPPPTLFRPSNWSQLYNDFIQECLEKSPENRPHSQELLEHPFFENVSENEDKIRNEIATSIASFRKKGGNDKTRPDILVRGHFWEQELASPQKLLQEDLAAMETVSEDGVLDELEKRSQRGQYYTFIGDVLLAINPYQPLDIYGGKHFPKYQFKARSDNAPHIYSVADKAYQDVLHNEEPQHIIFSGETMSGKTTNMDHALEHLLFLGGGNACVGEIRKAFRIIHAVGNAGTCHNPNSSRHLLQTQVTFTPTGKVSGAIFWLYLLEKYRVTTNDKKQANFHVFYYFYDHLEATRSLSKWNLKGGRDYRYLRADGNGSAKPGVRESPDSNVNSWIEFEDDLRALDFDETGVSSIKNILSAIILLGEIEFTEDDDGFAAISNYSLVETIATILSVDLKKFSWALLNYCVVEKGEATKRHHKLPEASEARDVLAQGLYSRLIDWIVCKINDKLSICRALFGDNHYISIVDLFGFECYSKNTMEPLFVNCVNEQLQFHYNQNIFVWEMQEGEEEEIPVTPLPYYDNKPTVDQLLSKPDGLMYIIDEASRSGGPSLILEKLQNNKRSHVSAGTGTEFSVAHYTGRIVYDASDLPDKNRDFLPPEMIETLRRSSLPLLQTMFTELFSRSGNLTVPANPDVLKKTKGRWGAALTAQHEKSRARRYNTVSRGQYSQTRQMRTSAATFRGTCLELLKNLAGGCGVHFVRCVRPNLTDQPGSFQPDLVRQQIKALAVVDTARGRQQGYSIRIPFNEFIRRYKFLAFDFEENVDVTKDNCRLLLVRLKMEGWVIGKTKVFLKYYNEEFLSRLYETQVKKIVKVQSMMRAFLAKRCIANKFDAFRKSGSRDDLNSFERGEKGQTQKKDLSKDEAATIIQKQIRGSIIRKQYGPLVRAATGKLDEETAVFMKQWCRKWKIRSIFQVLLLYRATRHQDLVYFCQQAHLYNQNALSELTDLNEAVSLKDVDPKLRASTFLPPKRPAVHKLPFRLGDLPFFDNTYICDPSRGLHPSKTRNNEETWDAPLKRNVGEKYARPVRGFNFREQGCQTYIDKQEYTKFAESSPSLPETPFIREPAKCVKLPQQDFRGHKGGELAKNQVYRGNAAAKKAAPQLPREIIKESCPGGRKYNPIREMEDKFRQSSGESDEPPFNFQAMLRKTNTSRESLKRSDNGFISPTNNNVVFNSNFNSNVNNNNNNASFTNKTSNDSRTPSSVTPTVDIRPLELAPGLIVHGEVADL